MPVPDPVTRKEQYLSKAATGSGSTPDPVTREEMYLAEIANGGGGLSFPAVTSDDNGKVLTVVNGAWAAGDSGSGFFTIQKYVVNESSRNLGYFKKSDIDAIVSSCPPGILVVGDTIPSPISGYKVSNANSETALIYAYIRLTSSTYSIRALLDLSTLSAQKLTFDGTVYTYEPGYEGYVFATPLGGGND